MNTIYSRFIFFTLLFCRAIYVQAQCGTYPTNGTTNASAGSSIINSYYPGTGNPTAGSSSLTVGTRDARGATNALTANDLVLIIQMQGADLNTANTDAYGDGVTNETASGYLTTNLMAGYYEYNNVASYNSTTGVVTFTYPLANNYYTRTFGANGIRTYQVIRLQRYYNYALAAGRTITAPAWNGATGGVVALDAANTITINGIIDVAGKGFRGGGGKQLTGATNGNSNGASTLSNTDYRFNSAATTVANLTGGAKGEGIAGTPRYILNQGATTTSTLTTEGYLNGSMGRGAPGNAGGGGTDGSPVGATSENQYNTGGGGGGNGGIGGKG